MLAPHPARRVGLAALLLLLAGASTALARANVRTDFDPRVDGLPFENTGDFLSPEGNCWGMSLIAIDSYLRRMAGTPRPGHARPPGTGHHDEYAASWMQAAAEATDDGTENPRVPLRDPSQLNAALDRIEASGAPEVLSMEFTDGGAHAVVVYGYEDGRLLVYDPNFPGETIRWPFDPVKGLGRHPKAASSPRMYGRIKSTSSTPQSQHIAAARLEEIRQACAADAPVCTDRFPITSAALERQPDGSVVVTGTVSRGAERDLDGNPTRRPDRVWISVNGRVVGTAPVNRFGTYRVRVPRAALRDGEPNTVRIIAEAPVGNGRQRTTAGTRDFQVPVTDPAPVVTRPAPQRPSGGRQPGGRPSRTRGLAGAIEDGE